MIVSERFVNRHAVPSRAGYLLATSPDRIFIPLNL